MGTHLRPLLACAALLGALVLPSIAQSDRGVSAQGYLLPASSPLEHTSPRGTLRVTGAVERGDFHRFRLELTATPRDGKSATLPNLEANGFLATDVGAIVTLDASESAAIGTRVRVIDLSGATLHESLEHGLADARLSADGTALGFRAREGLVLVDLRTFERSVLPELSPFALGSSTRVAGVVPGTGVLTVHGPRGQRLSLTLAEAPRAVAFASRGTGLLVMGAEALWRIDLRTGDLRTLYSAAANSELRDLRVSGDGVFLGQRSVAGGSSTGSLVQLAATGPILIQTRSAQLPTASSLGGALHPAAGIPWPLAPNAQHPIGNTYAEYQNYGGSPYMHPGIDVLGDDGQAVFAVDSGVVKAILTTSASLHWRVAIGQAGAGTTTGYLYAHLDQPTIAVNVGDSVVRGQYLGDLVPWPVAGFTHCHFARLEDTGTVWSGDWLCTDNPHLDLRTSGDTTPPFFEDAVGMDLFAFCDNETSNYQAPNALTGAVDIIAHVGDLLASTWVCAVQELRYTIHPAGDPGSPVVDDKLAVSFDMELDTYANGPFDPFLVALLYKEDATCDTDGDYNSREFFHVITNSDGNQLYEPSDQAEAWDTALLPDGDYVIRVTARDAAGNSATASMTVTTSNGNP